MFPLERGEPGNVDDSRLGPGYRGFDGIKIMHGASTVPEVALTFDDGPHPQSTPRLLQILDQYHVKATFFVVGKMVDRYPDLIRAEIASGHSVGNHTYHHINLLRASDEEVMLEVQSCGDALKAITHQEPHLFRPPGGDYDNRVAQDAAALGYKTVLWTLNPGDYRNPGVGVIESRLLSRIRDGSIILLHDGAPQTMEMLPMLLEYLQSHGFLAVTVDRLIEDSKNAPMEPSRTVATRRSPAQPLYKANPDSALHWPLGQMFAPVDRTTSGKAPVIPHSSVAPH
jgi:peptidoglycan/xylan/chitin deacetylase (PgdA/CDA1 family)